MPLNQCNSSIFALSFLCLLVSMAAAVGDTNAKEFKCELDNAALQAMYRSTVSFESGSNGDETTKNIVVKTADNNATRAAGFQRVCASTIAKTPILFLFNSPVIPNFHMNNVVAAIDIAFIDEHGEIESIHAMQPYSLLLLKKPLYSPKRPIVAALEARPGFFSDNNLMAGDAIRWVADATDE